ncbi:AAA family ATPase [Kitasatospora purpeofusca]|uniref:AAA family ATPase n=1 Tax=Kitasatospora purpeofusca TaxID=67352 RepID=UPI003F4AB82E
MVRALVAGVGTFPALYVREDEQADGRAEFAPLPAVPKAVRVLAFAMDRAGAVTGGDPLLECSRAEFTRAWEELRRDTAVGEPLVVHFSGHGTQPTEGGALYLATAGGEPHDDQLDDTCLSFETLLRTARNSGRPVLFLLDVCEAGQAVVQQQLTDLTTRRRQNVSPNVWIVGACTADAVTYGARFTTATAEILHHLADGDLDISPDQEFVPVTALARAVHRHLAVTDRAAGLPGQILVHTSHVHPDPQPQPFFRNPAHHLDPRTGLLTGMNPRLREFALACTPGLDPLHFATRAAGEPTAGDILFSGRTTQLRRIQTWTESPDEGAERLLVVTGGPGSGKSALLGVTTCLLHPELERLGDRIARNLEHFEPRQPRTVLAVHARRLTLQQITDSLRQQLRRQHSNEPALTAARPGSTTTAALVRELAEARDTVLILDALDEADTPAAVLGELLLPLVAAHPSGPPAGCRVVIGTRPWWDTLPALHRHLTEHPDALLDLDPATEDERRTLADDLNTYLRKILPRRHPREETRNIADRLARYTDHGAFLVAYLYANHLTTTPHSGPPTPPPCSVTEVFDLHLDTLTATDPWIRPVLTVLGQARGQGMPLDLVHHAALAHQPPAPGRPAPQLADTRRALGKAAFYLRTTADTDHTVLYRYFHQALVDHTLPRTDPATVHHAMTSTVPTTTIGTPDWQHAPPYLLRHAGDHAATAGADALDRLLTDPGFLLHAEPDHLTPRLRQAGSNQARLNARIYRATTTHDARRHRLEVRRSLLALDAAAWQRPDLAHAITRTPPTTHLVPPVPRWTTRPTDPADLDTVTAHRGSVTDIAVTDGPDGPLVITTSHDWTAIVWNPATGERLHTLNGHTGPVTAIAVAKGPDGPLVITTSHDWTAIVWNPATGERLHTLTGHSDAVLAVAAVDGPDGPLAITGGVDCTTRVWNPATGEHLHTLTGHSDAVLAVAAVDGPDGPLAIAAGHNHDASVWNPATGEHLHTLTGHNDALTGVVAMTGPDGPLAVTSGWDNRSMFWNPATGKWLHTLTRFSQDLRSAVVAKGPDRRLPITIENSTAIVWNLGTGERLHTLTGHTSEVSAIAVADGPNGPLAVTASTDGSVIVWDPATGERLHTLVGHPGTVAAAAVTTGPDGLLAITAALDGHVVVRNAVTGEHLHTLTGHTEAVTAVVVADGPNGPLAITVYMDCTTRVWNPATGEHLHTLNGTSYSSFFPRPKPAATVAQGPDGPFVITADTDGSVIVWNPATSEHLHTLNGHTSRVTVVAVADGPNGPLAITTSGGHAVIVWNLGTGERLHSLTGRTSPVTSIAVADGPNGPLVITTGWDRAAMVWNPATSDDWTAMVWDPVTGEHLRTLNGHTGPVTAVVVADGPNGPLAITTSDDWTAMVWDPVTGEHLRTLNGHTGPVTAVVVADGPNGPLAITTSTDGSVIFWNPATGTAVQHCHLPYGAQSVAACDTGFLVTYANEAAYFEWPASQRPTH